MVGIVRIRKPKSAGDRIEIGVHEFYVGEDGGEVTYMGGDVLMNIVEERYTPSRYSPNS